MYGLLVGYYCLNGLDSGNWRLMIFWTVLPGFLAAIGAYIFMDEPARFSLAIGKSEQAFETLEKMLKFNN